MKEVKEVKVTKEDRDLVFKGIRPENMEQVVFKQVRKDLQRAYKRYKGGQFKHVSVNLEPKLEVKSEGTYTRNTKKRYEGIGRKWERDNNLNNR